MQTSRVHLLRDSEVFLQTISSIESHFEFETDQNPFTMKVRTSKYVPGTLATAGISALAEGCGANLSNFAVLQSL